MPERPRQTGLSRKRIYSSPRPAAGLAIVILRPFDKLTAQDEGAEGLRRRAAVQSLILCLSCDLPAARFGDLPRVPLSRSPDRWSGRDIVRSWCSASFRHQNAGLARFNSEDTATHGPWSLSRGSNRSAAPPRGPRYTGPCRNGRWPSGFPCKGKRSVREVERAGIDYWGREAERPERKGLEVRVWKSRPRQQRRYLATASERRPDHLVFKR